MSLKVKPLENGQRHFFNFSNITRMLFMPDRSCLLEKKKINPKKLEAKNSQKKNKTFKNFFENQQQSKSETIPQAFDYLLYNYEEFENENDPKANESNFRDSFKNEGCLVHTFNKKKLPSIIPFRDECSLSLFSLNDINKPNQPKGIESANYNIRKEEEILNGNVSESLWFYNKENKTLVEWDLNENQQTSELKFQNLTHVTCLEICEHQIFFAISEEIKGTSMTTIITQKILIWRLPQDNSGLFIHLNTDHAASINILKISKNGKMMVSSALDFSITIWEAENNFNGSFKKTKFLIQEYKKITSAITPFVITDKELIYSPSLGKIKYEKGNQLISRAHAGDITCFLLKEDESKIVTGSQDCSIKIWNFDKPIDPEVIKYKKPILALAFDKTEDYLFSSSLESLIRIWDIKRRHIISQLDFEFNFAKKINLSQAGNFLALGISDNTIKYFSIDGIEKDASITLNSKITKCILSPDGKSLFIGNKHHESTKDKNANKKEKQDKSTDLIKVLDITTDITNTPITNFNEKGHNGDIIEIASTPNAKKLVSASSDKTINLYSLENHTLLYTYPIIHTKSITSLVIIDDETAMTGGEDNRIIKWDLNINNDEAEQGKNEIKKYKIFKENCHVDMVRTLNYSAKIKKLISGGGKLDNFIKIWDYEKQTLIGEIEAHRQRINCILVSKNFKHFFTGGKDCTIKKWDINNKTLLHKMNGHTDEITFLLTTDMKVVISGSADGDILLWEVKNCMKMGILRGNCAPIMSLVISKDQSTLFSVSNENVIRKWNLENYLNLNFDEIENEKNNDNQKMMLKPNKKPSVSAIHLTDDEDFIIVGYRDGSLLIYDFETNQTFTNKDINEEKIEEFKNEFRPRKNLSIVNIVSKDHIENGKKTVQIWTCCSDNKIKEFKFDKISHQWFDQKGEIIIFAKDSIYSLELFEDDLIYGNGKELNCMNKGIEIENKGCHNDFIFSISCCKQYVVTGSADRSFILWEKNETKNKIEKLQKISEKHDGQIIFVKLVQSAEKILTASSDGFVKIWDRERMEVIKKFNVGVGLFICCSYIDKSQRLILLNNIIIDLQNDNFLFKIKKKLFSFNRYLTAFSRKNGKLFMVSEENNNFYYGSLVSCHLFDYLREYSSFYFFFHKARKEDLLKSKNKIFSSLFKGEFLFWPYFFNFLHLIAVMNNTGEFEIKNLENFNNLSLSLFLQVDYKQRTCIDILLQKDEVNVNLVSIYFNLLFMAFDKPETEFYQKTKFLNYDFRKLQKPENMFHLLKVLMNIFHQETNITCEILKRCYIDHPNLKNIKNELTNCKKKLPILCTANDKLYNNLIFNHKFLYKLEHFLSYMMILFFKIYHKFYIYFYGIHKRTPNLKCKIICLPGFIHFSIKEVEHLFKHICAMSLSNEIYSSKALQLVTQYKWNVELKSLFVKEMCYFISFIFFFHANFAYLLPFTEDGIPQNILIFVIDIILSVFVVYYFIVEIRQIYKFKLKKYVLSIFNWIDLLLIILVAFSIASNLYQMLDFVNLEYQDCKLIYSVASFFGWLRLVSYYRGFMSTGFMIRLIIKVLYDMRHFSLIVFTFILGFTYAGYLILGHWDYTVFEVFLMYYRAVLGDFNAYDAYYDAFYYSVVFRIYLIMATVLLTVTLLNLMIAIINATYAQVVASEEKTGNYELMSLIYDMESTIDFDICSKREKKSRFQGKYLIYIYEDYKIQKVNTVEDLKMVETRKNIEKAVKILKGMTETKTQKELRDRKKEIIEKKFFKNIVMRETQDVYQVLLEIKDHLYKVRVNSIGEKFHLINSLILYTESINEAMLELFYLASMDLRNFEEKSNDFVKLLLFELDELYKYLFLNNAWWTGEGQTRLFSSIQKIRKNIESLDLSVGVYFISESKNLKDLESIINLVKNDNKREEYEKFRNLKAANFWVYSFGNENHVSFKTFISKFRERIYALEMINVNETHIDVLREELQNEAHMVSYKKWDDYYINVWSNYEKRQDFLETISSNENQKKRIQSALVLEYQYIDESKKSYKDFPDFTTFIIKRDEYEYTNFKGELIKESKDLSKEAIIFGRETIEFIPDISFDSEVMTINIKQFQISVTKSSDKFYICDLSLANETFLLVESTKYLLSKNMMLEINKIVFEVCEINPPLNEIGKSDNYFIIDKKGITNYLLVDENEKPFLKLKSLDESFSDIILGNKKKEYKLGLSKKGNDFVVGVIGGSETQSKSDNACKITFENNHWGIQSNNLNNEKDYFSSTFIFLKNHFEYENNEIGFNGVALEKGMKIFSNGHLFNIVNFN